MLALTFVQVSFVANLFSMNEIYVPGGPHFRLYFAVAVEVFFYRSIVRTDLDFAIDRFLSGILI